MDTLQQKLNQTIVQALAGDPAELERRIELAKNARYRPMRRRPGWTRRRMPGEADMAVHLRSGTVVPIDGNPVSCR